MICTHDAVFHADDVFGGAIVRLMWPHEPIVRTRNPATLAAAALCFDVGGGDYDHHQAGGNGARPNGVPYAACGLLWRDFGPMLCDDPDVAAEVDRQLIQPIDAHDNGYTLADPRYAGVWPCTVSHLISNFNPSWHEAQDFDAGYFEAVAFASGILERAIARARGVVEARGVVAQAVTDAADPRIVALPYFVPWQEALIDASAAALLCVYPSADTWRVQVVPVAAGQPGARIALPEAWAALEGEALAALTDVEDATFCHRQRFIAGARTRTGALALARLALV
jgi:uncharacterized UPF0160 family protein